MRIGIDSFSYHRLFGDSGPWEKESDLRWSVHDFLCRAAELRVDDVSLQTVYLPDLDCDTATTLRQEMAALGLQPTLAWGHRNGLEGGSSPNKAVSLRRMLPIAQAVGARTLRVVCGDQLSWHVPAQERIARLAPILEPIAVEAAQRDLTLAIENHADFAMADLVTLVETVPADNVGICFDTGNAIRVGDDLLEALALAAPHIVMVHLKDIVPQEASRGNPGAWWPSAPLGRGQIDIRRVVTRLATYRYSGCLFIEMANMVPSWPDEDKAVEESVSFLRRLLNRRSLHR